MHPDEGTEPRSVGVALSGGGYRATAFGLGVLLYLADIEKLESVGAVASVSGGSITNAYVARNLCRAGERLSGQDAWQRSEPLLMTLSARSLYQPRILIAAALVLPLLVGVGALVFGLVWWGALLAGLGTFVVYTATVWVGLRSFVEAALLQVLEQQQGSSNAVPTIRRAMNRVLRFYGNLLTLRWKRLGTFWERPDIPTLGTSRSVPTPVYCSTDLASGTHFYLSEDFVTGVTPRLERGGAPRADVAGAAPGMPVTTAVMASAAVPGVFQPVTVRTSEFGLPRRAGLVPDLLRLADGGLYDNLGFTFFLAWRNGDLPASVVADLPAVPTQYIVVNSGAPLYGRGQLGVLRAMKRSMDVVHQANTAARCDDVRQFLSKSRTVDGVIVSIADDPYAIALRARDSESKKRALDALERLEADDETLTHSWWCSVGQELDPSVKTDLRKLGAKTTARLVFHGYVSALVHTTLGLGWTPPSEIPNLATIERRCEGADR